MFAFNSKVVIKYSVQDELVQSTETRAAFFEHNIKHNIIYIATTSVATKTENKLINLPHPPSDRARAGRIELTADIIRFTTEPLL